MRPRLHLKIYHLKKLQHRVFQHVTIIIMASHAVVVVTTTTDSEKSSTALLFVVILKPLLRVLVFSNGVYDLLCFLCIIMMKFHRSWMVLNFFGTLHINVFRDEDDRRHPLVRRMLAYWVLTYGMVRVLAGVADDSLMNCVAALTYLIEAFAFGYEFLAERSVIGYKVAAISLMSLLIAALLNIIIAWGKNN